MKESVFFEMEFLMLIATSVVIPVAIYVFLLKIRAISRSSVLFFAFLLILLSGVDVYLLQSLARHAKSTLSAFDDRLFSSELSMALYLIPIVFGGIGVNLVSHVLVGHLNEAERRFDSEHPSRRRDED